MPSSPWRIQRRLSPLWTISKSFFVGLRIGFSTRLESAATWSSSRKSRMGEGRLNSRSPDHGRARTGEHPRRAQSRNLRRALCRANHRRRAQCRRSQRTRCQGISRKARVPYPPDPVAAGLPTPAPGLRPFRAEMVPRTISGTPFTPIKRLSAVMHQHVTHNRFDPTQKHCAHAIQTFFRETIPNEWTCVRGRVSDNFKPITHDKFRILGGRGMRCTADSPAKCKARPAPMENAAPEDGVIRFRRASGFRSRGPHTCS